jgi:hypothetical protein
MVGVGRVIGYPPTYNLITYADIVSMQYSVIMYLFKTVQKKVILHYSAI